LPLYEYRCLKCGAHFEKIVKFSDPPLRSACEKCGGKIEQLLSAPAIQFKGSGWYITDYARKSSPEPTNKAESSGDGKAGSTTSDSKKSAESKKPAEPATAKNKNKN
jgi:putative FmdB family regulatory protein